MDYVKHRLIMISPVLRDTYLTKKMWKMVWWIIVPNHSLCPPPLTCTSGLENDLI